ncbi:MAG TPA: hypothetical protein VLX28_27680 [Thermoanaerobaculia bacterium]|nr:hypothetical protein [Thermoanaerobaculia bacterium]
MQDAIHLLQKIGYWLQTGAGEPLAASGLLHAASGELPAGAGWLHAGAGLLQTDLRS